MCFKNILFWRVLLAAALVTLSATTTIMSGTLAQADMNDKTDGYLVEVDSQGVIHEVKGNPLQDEGNSVDPSKIGSSIPVRVLTSYSHEGVFSSDANSVKSASGEVSVQIMVQNLTSKVEELATDVNGSQVKKMALVSTPLTVAASTVLEGVKPDEIVLRNNSEGAATTNGTNGVVSVNDEGKTVVQWAAILGYKSLPNQVAFTLSLKTDDFKIPKFNVSVQQGFMFDNSNDGSDVSEKDLVEHTIETLNEAGAVLADSGKALDQARDVLTNVGEKVGEQTIRDLNSSNGRVLSSASSVAGTLNQLNFALTGAYQQTGSEVMGQLSNATATVQELMGNPEIEPKPLKIDEDKCVFETVVNPSNPDSKDSGNGIYGVIGSLSQRLEAFASASKNCQHKLINGFGKLLGPKQPDGQSCIGNQNTMSCRLYGISQKINDVSDKLKNRAEELKSILAKNTNKQNRDALSELNTKLSALKVRLEEMKAALESGQDNPANRQLTDSITKLIADYGTLQERISAQADTVETLAHNNENQQKEIDKLVKFICDNTKSDKPGGTPHQSADAISADMAKQMLDQIGVAKCPQPKGDGDKEDPLEYKNDSIGGLAQSQKASLDELDKQLKDTSVQESIASTFALIDSDFKAFGEALQKYQTAESEFKKVLSDKYANVNSALSEVNTAFWGVRVSSGNISDDYSDLSRSLNQLVESSQQDMKQVSDWTIKQTGELDRYRENADRTSEETFGHAHDALLDSAEQFKEEGRQAIVSARDKTASINNSLSSSIDKRMKDNAETIHKTTNKAIEDSNAVSKLLSEDIAKVILDIGSTKANGGGLLGAIYTANGHLGTAENKMSESVMSMSRSEFSNRASLRDDFLSQAEAKASLERLETDACTADSLSDRACNSSKLWIFEINANNGETK